MDMQMTVTTRDMLEDAIGALQAAGFRASEGNRRVGDPFSIVSLVNVDPDRESEVERIVKDVDLAATRLL